MRGHRYTSDMHLSERDLHELADLLALQLHERLGSRVYLLQRGDITELITSYIDDLAPTDRQAIPWMIWHLFQDALEIELEED